MEPTRPHACHVCEAGAIQPAQRRLLVSKLGEKAAAMGMTPAQWLRAAALARRLPPTPVARVNLDTYRELARIGVNLNQAVRELHVGAAAGIPQEVLTGLFQAVLTVQRQVIGGGGDDRQPE